MLDFLHLEFAGAEQAKPEVGFNWNVEIVVPAQRQDADWTWFKLRWETHPLEAKGINLWQNCVCWKE